MDSEFLKQQADRCRSLAEKADRFTKKRLLDLAAKYGDRLTRSLRSPRGGRTASDSAPPDLGFIG
jgi:hypothetical protein